MMVRLQDLLHLCHLPLLASGILLPPRELILTSENFKNILTWEEPNNESLIFYNVKYQINYGSSFHTVADCSNITTRQCDLTKVFSDIWKTYIAQVQSFTSTERSDPSRLLPAFKPLGDTVVGPPIVDVVATDSGINVSISVPVSYLWNKNNQRFDSILTAYPAIDYEIFLEPSTGVPIFKEAVYLESITIPIPSLSPSTTYCVNVSMSSENINRSIQSPKKCAITKGPLVKGDNRVYWIVAGVMLLIILPLLLIVLDRAGYINRKKIFPPNVLASLPDSRNLLHGTDPLTLIPMIPMEFVNSLENEEINEDPERRTDSAPYIAHNLNAVNEEQQDILNQGNRVPTRGHSESPLLDLTKVVLSEVPNVQAMISIGDSISTEHPAVIPWSERSMDAPSEDTVGSAEALLSTFTNGFDDSLNLSHTNNHFGIDLNSVSLRDSVDLCTSFPRVGSPKEDSNVLASHPNGDAVNISQFNLLCSVFSADAPAMDNLEYENNEDGGKDSGLICASDYMRR